VKPVFSIVRAASCGYNRAIVNSEPVSVRSILHRIQFSKGRVEALTDGIFAIAMTLLVLELKIPAMPKNTPTEEILGHLREEIPAFFSFFFSFMYCGLLWVLHHMAMHFVRHVRVALVWLNLIFLLTISLLPFSCALLGHFIRNVAVQEIYFGNMFLASTLLLIQWIIARSRGMLNQDDPRAAQVMEQQLMIFPIALAAAMVATPYRPTAGFYAMSLVMLAVRIWQRRFVRLKATAPATPSA
jgi:TMEM175 potassium channel family protein